MMTRFTTYGRGVRALLGASSMAVAIGLFGAASAAAAQVTPPVQDNTAAAEADEADEATTRDIIVTGSRIVRNGNDAPSPITVVSSEDLQVGARARVSDYLNDLPALSGSTTPRTAGVGVGGGTAGANLLNLRNLGVVRTLTLLDGRRVVPSTTTGAVDVNLLPTALVRSVDIVTGGASAVYGADAVAGVVNFVLDTTFTGLKGEVQAGATTRGDGSTKSATFSYGTPFAGDKGHVIANVAYTENGEVLYRNRGWARGNYIVNNPAFAVGNGQPRRLLASGAGLNAGTPGGIVTGGPLRGTQFDANGAPRPFNYGTTGGIYSISPDAYDANEQIQLLAPVKQVTAFTRAQFDVADNVMIFGEFAYGHSITDQSSASYFRLGNIVVRNDNAFLDPVTRARMDAAGVTTLPFGRYNTNLGLAQPRNDRELFRYVVGASGTLANDFKWNLSYNRGRSTIETIVANDVRVSRYNLAIDAVRAPSGQIVCRSTLTAPGNGCIPYNLFGTQPVSQAQIDYLTGTASQTTRLTQDVVSADLAGDLFALPGGDLSFAVGAEYRREKGRGDADAASLVNDFFVGNYKPFSGRVSVREAFVELVAPVFKDTAIGKSLELTGAARLTDYSTSGTETTWKLGAVYEAVAGLRLRVTRSRDIRAPNINDLFLGGQLNTQTVNDPLNNNQTYTILRRTAGNPALRPEVASTLVAGVIFAPDVLPGFSVSADYFSIKLKDAIDTVGQQDLVNRCAGGQTEFCGFITRNGGIITQVDTLPVNFQVLETEGLDIEAGYRSQARWGTFSLRGLASYVSKLTLGSGAGAVTRAGEVGDNGVAGSFSVPHWKGRVTANVRFTGGTSVALTSRFVGASRQESDWGPLDIDDNDVPHRFYFDLYAAQEVRVGDNRFELFGAIDNLTDRDPPPVPSTSSLPFVTTQVSAGIYDTLGRSFRVGARIQF